MAVDVKIRKLGISLVFFFCWYIFKIWTLKKYAFGSKLLWNYMQVDVLWKSLVMFCFIFSSYL